mmetsp:Transcript_1242/g.3567  ORF Transcript_1242/g.3567 Transcript_1242/m.3567 type:complete len:365 (-) Transcript_1242:198-1292(-)
MARCTISSACPAATASGLMMASVVCISSSSGKSRDTADAATAAVAGATTGVRFSGTVSKPRAAESVDVTALPAGPVMDARARTAWGRDTQMAVHAPDCAYLTRSGSTPGSSLLAMSSLRVRSRVESTLKPRDLRAATAASTRAAELASGSTRATVRSSRPRANACAPKASPSWRPASSRDEDTSRAFLIGSVPKRARMLPGACSRAAAGSAGPTSDARSPMAKGFSRARRQLGSEVTCSSSWELASGSRARARSRVSVPTSSATTTKPLLSRVIISSSRVASLDTSGLRSAKETSFGKASGKNALSSRSASSGLDTCKAGSPSIALNASSSMITFGSSSAKTTEGPLVAPATNLPNSGVPSCSA